MWNGIINHLDSELSLSASVVDSDGDISFGGGGIIGVFPAKWKDMGDLRVGGKIGGWGKSEGVGNFWDLPLPRFKIYLGK